MKAYRRDQLLIVVGFLAAMALPPAATVLEPGLRGDLFPLSMWAMFYRVHNVLEDFGLLVVEVDGQPLDPPRYFEDAGAWLPAHGSIRAYHAIQALGRALATRDAPQAASLRALIETTYLRGPAAIGYRITRRRWDPFRRWRQHAFLAEEPLATFRADALPAAR